MSTSGGFANTMNRTTSYVKIAFNNDVLHIIADVRSCFMIELKFVLPDLATRIQQTDPTPIPFARRQRRQATGRALRCKEISMATYHHRAVL